MPLTRKELIQQQENLAKIDKHVNLCFDKAEVFFGTTFKRSHSNFKQRGKAAGTAHLQKNELRFNHFMYTQNPDVFLKTVIPHEVAHIIVFQIYASNVKPHGKEWQAVMRKVYGLLPERTHSFDVPPLKNAYSYYCLCQTHEFSQRRHSRVLKGVEYSCKKCGSKLAILHPRSDSVVATTNKV